jgi:hypothetical protein
VAGLRFAWLVALVLLPATTLMPQTANAQIYRWVDDNGDTHFTTGLTSVPQRHRKSAELFAVPSREPAPPPAAGALLPARPYADRVQPGGQILVSARLNDRGR